MISDFKQRMYSLVLYNLSPIQQGIQAYHATIKYSRSEYGISPEYAQWADIDQTVIILNGGGSSNLNALTLQLLDNKVEIAEFSEPDLYDQVTAVSFLVDERVWDRERYYDLELHEPYVTAGIHNRPDLQEKIKAEYIASIGGEKNFFLRNFLRGLRLA